MRTARVLSLFIAVLAGGCSLIVNTADRTQCQTNADCEGNPALRGRECKLGFCVVPSREPGPVRFDAGSACVSTELCTQANSGRASVCKRAGSPCVPWESDECPTITGAWDDPNAILVGSLLPLNLRQPDNTAPPHPYSKRILRAIDLAVEEVAAATPSGFFIAGEQRPVALLHCDSQGHPDTARRMFEHLTDVVGAEAVIVGWDEDLASIATLATQKKTTIICSDCLAPAPPGPTTWNILPSITGDAALAAWRISDLEVKIKQQDPADLRVAVLVDGLRVQKLYANELSRKLVFNGKSAAANGTTGFLPLSTGDPRTEFVDYVGLSQQLADFAPHVIAVAMASDFPKRFLPLIESKWHAGNARPHYVVTQISYDAASFDASVPQSSDELRQRISGTHPATTPELAANIGDYTNRYRGSYNEPPDGNFSGYEAFYATALAIAAASGQPLLDGARISAGFASLVSGTTVDIGPAGLGIGLPELAKGNTIDIRGLYTNLDWSLATREVSSDMAMFCFGRHRDGHLFIRDDAGVVYSAATQQVSGTYLCE